jgi:hypothetical protein
VLCHAWSITGEDPLITKMMAATLRHAEVVEELIALQTAMSSTVEHVLECSPGRAS